ncbi:MAG: helix-turn-helix transcriptional regulator [Hyphomonadaceae bacterium]|nr:helix-turn-helix transcriptional regulator [Hyphomonadaceae bacterium]
MARRPPSRRKKVASLHSAEYGRFIEMLVERRQVSGLSQQELADRLGLPQSLIAKIEQRERRVDIIELIQIASVVGFDVARLVREVRADMIKHGVIDG